jgi:hypothetical protein
MSKIFETIKKELLSWPYVTVQPHRFGGIEFLVNKREMGHIHEDRVVDLPSQNYTIPRWHKQLHCLEVWIEKQIQYQPN